jgi:hypothetical protein
LARGADVNAANNKGETAVDLTRSEEVKALLRVRREKRIKQKLCF